MNVVVNGAPQVLGDGATVADVVAALGQDVSGRGVAVAVNGEVVPRSGWSSAPLADDDHVEIVRAVGGG